MGMIDLFAQSVEIDGYEFSQITLADWAEFTWYFKYYPVKEAEYAIRDFSPDMKQQTLKETYEECKKRKLRYVNPENPEEFVESEVSFEHPEVQAFVMTAPGMLYMLYLSLRHKRPEITLDDVKLIGTSEFLRKFDQMVLQQENEAVGEDENPTIPIGNQ